MKLIQEGKTFRIYQLDFKIYKYKWLGKIRTIKELFAGDPVKLKESWIVNESLEYIDKVCVSDAHTHTERLVFPSFEVLNTETKEKTITQWLNSIAGQMTMMIHGGDPDTIHDDKVYIRFLRMINKGEQQ